MIRPKFLESIVTIIPPFLICGKISFLGCRGPFCGEYCTLAHARKLMAPCKSMGEKSAVFLADDMKYCVYSGCVLYLPGWCCGEVFKGVGYKCMALSPWPSKGPAHFVRQKLFLALVRTDCTWGPILASIHKTLMLTFQRMCVPIWSWILLLNFKVAMSDFFRVLFCLLFETMQYKINSTLSAYR